MAEPPVVEIRIRISRRLLIGLILVLVVLPLAWLALQTLGGSGHG